jgi:hypothetical protein
VHVLHNVGHVEALQYVRASFGPFASCHITKIQRLMGCLLWAGCLEASPYLNLLSPSHWDAVALEITRECCKLLGQAYESLLQVTMSAGSQALPTWIKLVTVMANKKQMRLSKSMFCVCLGVFLYSCRLYLQVCSLQPHGSLVSSLWQYPYSQGKWSSIV